MSLALVTAISALLIASMKPVAVRVHLVDCPNARKAHLGEVPLVGGLGIFIGFSLATLLLRPEFAPNAAFFIASLVLVVGGVLDDRFDLHPFLKLAFQSVAVLTMCVAGDVYVRSLGGVFPMLGTFDLGVLAVPFTLVAAVGIINAVNLTDGLDGLAGFQLLVAFSALAFLAHSADAAGEANKLLLLIACVSGFLLFNARILGRKKATVFLGDAGTMFLGFAYVWFAIDLSAGPAPVMSPVTALWLLAFPICETVTMIIRRVSRRRSPFEADKEHLHHVLTTAGFTAGEAVMILTGLAAGGALIGVAGEMLGVPSAVMFMLFILAAGLYLWTILRAWTVMRLLCWSICRRKAVCDRRRNVDRRRVDMGPPAGRFERRSGVDRRRAQRRAADAAAQLPPSRVRVRAAASARAAVPGA